MFMKLTKKQYVMVGLVVLTLGVIYFLAGYVVPRVLVTLTKAAPAYKVSIGNSRILGETILAKADGKEKCVVNVFVMDTSDKGVPKREVVLSGMDNISPRSVMTDNSGKASFSMVSAEEKQYEISATVDGVRLPKTVKITFRND
jgi:hypothetical protein